MEVLMNDLEPTIDAIDISTEAEGRGEGALELRPPPKVRVKKQMREKHFSNALIIRRETGDKVLVPLEAKDNRHANMVVAAMVRELVKSNIDLYKKSNEPLKPKELVDVVTAAKLAAELSYGAYDFNPSELGPDGKARPPTGSVSGLITGMQAIGKGMADGFAEKPQGFAAIMQSLDALAKKTPMPKNVSPSKDQDV